MNEGNEHNIEALFAAVALNEGSDDKFTYGNRFKYVHDVISLSRIWIV